MVEPPGDIRVLPIGPPEEEAVVPLVWLGIPLFALLEDPEVPCVDVVWIWVDTPREECSFDEEEAAYDDDDEDDEEDEEDEDDPSGRLLLLLLLVLLRVSANNARR